MRRATITKTTLDSLIRAKMETVDRCPEVRPLPVVWAVRVGDGCNWAVPGWTGDAHVVRGCLDQINEYLRVLRTQFDIPDEA